MAELRKKHSDSKIPPEIKQINGKIGKISDYLMMHEYYTDKPTGEEIFARRSIKSLGISVFISIAIAIALIFKLFILQVEQGYLNLKLAEGNRLKVFSSAAPRGIIYDYSGKQLVENEPSYQLTLDSSVAKNISKINQDVWKIIGIDKGEAEKIIDNRDKSAEFVVIKDKISREDALLYKSRLVDFEGFEIRPFYTRDYIETSLSHVLGYIGKSTEDDIRKNQICSVNEYSGKSGLETSYDDYLQGKPGEKKAEVNVAGQTLRILSSEEPSVGDSLYTSIDLDLQKVAAQALESKANELHTKATLIALDPRNGAVRAMASYPYYDNTKMSSGITQDEYNAIISDSNSPLMNRAISGEYPPGSSIKPFIATAALEDKVVDASLSFDTPPEIQIGQWRFPDWKDHGNTDIKRAIAESNNIFFYALGGGWGPIKNGLGPDGLRKGLEKFGYGADTGIDLSAEKAGFIPTPEWKKKTTGESWFIGNTYNMSIGQGDLLVTPLQIANATAAIAENGNLFKPRLVEKIVNTNGELERDFTKDGSSTSQKIFSDESVNTVKEGMRMTITQGSAKSIFPADFPIAVAGKTGTAQFGNEGKTHAWFTSFAPYDNPQLVLTILVEGGGEGYDIAAPIARDIYLWYQENRMK